MEFYISLRATTKATRNKHQVNDSYVWFRKFQKLFIKRKKKYEDTVLQSSFANTSEPSSFITGISEVNVHCWSTAPHISELLRSTQEIWQISAFPKTTDKRPSIITSTDYQIPIKQVHCNTVKQSISNTSNDNLVLPPPVWSLNRSTKENVKCECWLTSEQIK